MSKNKKINDNSRPGNALHQQKQKDRNMKDRGIYLVDARNFSVGIYQEADNSFFGLRHKFGDRFVDKEYHWDEGPPYGTVKVDDDPIRLGEYEGNWNSRDEMFKALVEVTDAT